MHENRPTKRVLQKRLINKPSLTDLVLPHIFVKRDVQVRKETNKNTYKERPTLNDFVLYIYIYIYKKRPVQETQKRYLRKDVYVRKETSKRDS